LFDRFSPALRFAQYAFILSLWAFFWAAVRALRRFGAAGSRCDSPRFRTQYSFMR
jgi:hypothetical protein